MARRYFNTGSFGRDYSQLTLINIGNDRAGISVYGKDGKYKDIGLNKEQIVDLITQLETIIKVKKTELPTMEGSI